MLLLIAACIVLLLTGGGGLAMLLIRLRGVEPPAWFLAAHGLGALTGITLVTIVTAMAEFRMMLVIVLGTLVTAASMGAYMGIRRARGRMAPLGLALGHATIAVFGIVMLLIATMVRETVVG